MDIKISLENCEHEHKSLEPENLIRAQHLFMTHGHLTLENLFTKDYIQNLYSIYRDQLKWNEDRSRITNAIEISDKRYIRNFALKKPFNDPLLYAHPLLLPLMQSLLGRDAILAHMGSVVSLQGANEQTIHADFPHLFDEIVGRGVTIPSFAITVAIPLVDIDWVNGPTRIWSGSHLSPPYQKETDSYMMNLLCGPIGCAYMWDYRTFHGGCANHSDSIRPFISLTYCRPWFRDSINPGRDSFEKADLSQIPEDYRHLFPQVASCGS